MTQPKTSLEPQYHKGFWTPEKFATKLVGTYSITGGAVTLEDGTGFTVAYDAAGLVTVSTVATHFVDMVCAHAVVESALANQDLYCQIAAIVSAGGAATTVQIRTTDTGAETDPTNGDDIHFEITLLSIGQDVA